MFTLALVRFPPTATKDIQFFFFSSSRRHTSSTRDWSSDVCSSDLRLDVVCLSRGAGLSESLRRGAGQPRIRHLAPPQGAVPVPRLFHLQFASGPGDVVSPARGRSEERRVGNGGGGGGGGGGCGAVE